jgi:uncharacterized protein (DUF885 family)
VLRERGRAEPHRVRPEVIRYLGWPGQAISYKLGERGWLAAREQATRQPGFDLKRWHTAALSLGPIGLGGLTEALASIGQSPDAQGMSRSSWQVAVCQLILSVA